MELPEGITEVDRLAVDGGELILGSDGGVYTTGTAQLYGAQSYQGLLPEQRMEPEGGRQWKAIHPDVSVGGYVLESTIGEKYHFNPPPIEQVKVPDPVETTQAPADAPPKGEELSGEAILRDALSEYGLDGLAVDLLEYYKKTGSVDATYIEMRKRPEYKTRFSGMAAREVAGYAPIDEEAYIQWEGTAKSLFDHYDIPKEFYDSPEELAAFIAGDVSPTELKSRIEKGYVAAMSAPPEMRDALQSMYGVTGGGLAAFFLDPTKGEEIIAKRWTASQIGGQAKIANFGDLSKAEAEKLEAGGLTSQEAQERFGVLGQQTELMEGSISEGGDISRGTQLEAVGGDVAAQAGIKKRAEQRKATFGGGGSFAGDKEGISGLGSAG